MQKYFIYTMLVISLFMGIFGLRSKTSAEAGDVFFYLELDKETYYNPDTISFDLKVETWVSGLNAISYSLDFDPESLALTDVNINGSICSLVAQEKTDNDAGHFQLDCGTFEQLAVGPEQVARLTFQKKSAGPTVLSATGESEAHLADGLGTVLNTVNEDNLVEIIK